MLSSALFNTLQSDEGSSSGGKFRRSAKSSFLPVELASKKNTHLALDFGAIATVPSDEVHPQLSFDNNSTTTVEEEPFDSPKNNKNKKALQRQRQQAQQQQQINRNRATPSPTLSPSNGVANTINIKKTPPLATKTAPQPQKAEHLPKLEIINAPSIEIDRSSPSPHNPHDDSTLTASDAGSLKSAVVPQQPPQADSSQKTKAPSVSSLNYSVSSVSVDPRPPLVATPVTNTHAHVETQSIIEDLDSSMSQLGQERLLDRLDQAASVSTAAGASPASSSKPDSSVAGARSTPPAAIPPPSPSKAAAFTTATNNTIYNTSNGKIVPLKPPPSLPPKPPRSKSSSLNNSRDSQQSSLSPQEEARILKQYEERLLQGGDFLNESGSTAASGNSGDLAMKLLSRLEEANADPQFLSDHHAQDPPLVMTTSFGSAAGMNAAVPVVARRPSNDKGAGDSGTINQQQRRPSNSSSSNASNPYAGFMVGGEPSKDRSHSRSAGGTYQKKMSTLHDGSNNNDIREDEDSKMSGPKINYQYSQDNEFENSILSPASVYSNSRAGSTVGDSHHHSKKRSEQQQRARKHEHHPRSPKNLYRSDAINAFLERADCMAPESQTMGSPARVRRNVSPGTAPSLAEGEYDDEDSNPVLEDDHQPRKLVSDEFLNIVTSGCTGLPNPAAKEAIAEKLVALEAGWSGFRTQVSGKMQDLEESWQNWNLNSLLKFPSPKGKGSEDVDPDEEGARENATAAAMDGTTVTVAAMGSTTVLTTPPSMSVAKKERMAHARKTRGGGITPMNMFLEEEEDLAAQAVELTLNNMDSVPKGHLDTSQDQVTLGVLKELRSARYGKDGAVAEAEKIAMGSEEHDVPLSLKNTLADISLIEDSEGEATGHGAHQNKNQHHVSCLDASREDSEGGKIVLDATEWDPVESSDTDIHVDLSSDPIKQDGFFYKHKGKGKILRSPTSVLVEI